MKLPTVLYVFAAATLGIGPAKADDAALLAQIKELSGQVAELQKAITASRSSVAFPPGTIVFTNGSDCGPVGSGWAKVDPPLEGRFVVIAGKNSESPAEFGPGHTGAGRSSITLGVANLPNIQLDIPTILSNVNISGKGYNVSRGLGPQGGDSIQHYAVAIDGKAEPIDITPPWVALTACRHN